MEKSTPVQVKESFSDLDMFTCRLSFILQPGGVQPCAVPIMPMRAPGCNIEVDRKKSLDVTVVLICSVRRHDIHHPGKPHV